MSLNRRQFAGTIAGGAVRALRAQPAYEWGNPVLDIHVHPRVGAGMPNIPGGELAHIGGSGVTKAVLLTRADIAERSSDYLGKRNAAL